MPLQILKPDLVADPDPNSVAPAASRIFTLNAADGGGALSALLSYKAKAVSSNAGPTYPSALPGTTFNILPYVYYFDRWVELGSPLLTPPLGATPPLSDGELSSTYFGQMLWPSMQFFLRMVNINASANATGLLQYVYDPTPSSAAPRNKVGFPQSGNALVSEFKTIAKVQAPTGVAVPVALGAGSHYFPEQFVMLQADGANTDYIELLDSADPAGVGNGIQIYAKGSVPMPVFDLAQIFIHSPSAGQFLRIAKF